MRRAFDWFVVGCGVALVILKLALGEWRDLLPVLAGVGYACAVFDLARPAPRSEP